MRRKSFSFWRLVPLLLIVFSIFLPDISTWYGSYFKSDFMLFIGQHFFKYYVIVTYNLQYYSGFLFLLYLAYLILIDWETEMVAKMFDRFSGVYERVDKLDEETDRLKTLSHDLKLALQGLYSKHLKLEENVKALTGLCPDEQAGREDLSKSFNQEH